MGVKKKIYNFVKNSKDDVLFLLNLKNAHSDLFLEDLFKKQNLKATFVLFNTRIPDSLLGKDAVVRLSEDFLNKNDYDNIDNYIFNVLSTSWYLHRDITNYRNIRLGNIVEYEFQKYLVPRIKNLEVILKVCELMKIDRIVSIDENGELWDAVRLFEIHYNVPVLNISYREGKKISSAVFAIKERFVKYVVRLIDGYAINKMMKEKQNTEAILIDVRLYNDFKNHIDGLELLQLPLEKGLSLRMKLLKMKKIFLPLSIYKVKGDKNKQKEFCRLYRTLLSDETFKIFFKYKTISIWEMVVSKLSEFFLMDFSRIGTNIDFLINFCNRNKIKLVMLRNDNKELEKTIIYATRLSGIPSLIIQHGVLTYNYGHYNLIADKMAVWGPASIELYRMFGDNTERFEVTGNPRFDILLNWKPQTNKDLLFKRIGLHVDKKTILFATQQINKFSSYWTDDLFIVMAKKIIQILRHSTDKQLIIKTDPYEDPSPYQELIKYCGCKNVSLITDIAIYDLIFYSDVLITLDSTVALEAIVFDKPVITFNLTKRQDRVPYAEKGAAIGVYNELELISAIDKALTDEETRLKLEIGRKNFLEEFAYKIDGKARERISTLIKHLVEN